VRRKNQCYIVVPQAGYPVAKCGMDPDEECIHAKTPPGRRRVSAICRYERTGHGYECVNPQARTEAATKLIKVLRRKYQVEE